MTAVNSSSSSSESYSGSSSSFNQDSSWIEWFCSQKEGLYYVEVDEDYVHDDFNLTGLRKYFEYYDEALNVILDCTEDDEYSEIINFEAMQLYGLIHARFLLTTRGQSAFKEKVLSGTYGTCPNHHCDFRKQALLPWGEDFPRKQKTFVFCPGCNEVYFPKSLRLAGIDGAHFGSSSGVALVTMAFPELSGTISTSHPTSTTSTIAQTPLHDPKLFGFRLHVSPENREALTRALKAKTLENSLVLPSNSVDADSESD